jgi:ankyrin repeat protein
MVIQVLTAPHTPTRPLPDDDGAAYRTILPAIVSRDLPLLQSLLDAGANPNSTAEPEPTLLERAILERFVDGALLLLERGARITEEDPSLLCSCVLWCPSAHLCRALINAGADVNELGMNNSTALYHAVKAGSADICRALLAAGASVPHRHDYEPETMTAAVTCGRGTRGSSAEIIRMLVAAGGSTSQPSSGDTFYREMTPFQVAVHQGYAANVKLMIDEFGEDPFQLTASGKTMSELTASEPVKAVLRAAATERTVALAIDTGARDDQNGSRVSLRIPIL